MIWKARILARTEYTIEAFLLLAMRMLPLRLAVPVAMFLTGIAYHLFVKLRRIGLRNLQFAFPETDLVERERILKQAFRNLGRILAYTSHFAQFTETDLRRLIVCERYPVSCVSQPENGRQGKIVISGHIGNWELLAFSYAVFFEPLTFMARQMHNGLLHERIRRLRTRSGNSQIDKSKSARAVHKILSRGGTVGILADVNSISDQGVFVPFFGIDACTPTGPAVLALRSNALICPAFCVWDRLKARYRLVFGQTIEPVRTDDWESDVARVTAAYTAEMEKIIRQFPDQWIWVHRRWKTRPSGQQPLY